MVGSIQEIAGKLYGMGDWLRVESMTIECEGETTVIDAPLGEDIDIPCPDDVLTITIRFLDGRAFPGRHKRPSD